MKRLCSLMVAIFLLSGCGVIAQRRQQEAFRQAEMVATECRQKRLAGQLKSYVESARCGQDRIRQVIADSGYPYMDLIDFQLAYRMALARRVDEGKLGDEEARLLYAELNARVNSEAQRRAMLTYQTQLQAQQAWTQWWQAWNQQRALESLRDPITCQQFGNTIQCR